MSHSTLYYLAYGSNLHPVRLTERVPSATLLGITRLDGFQMCFHKRGQDRSAKCNLVPCSGPRLSPFPFGAIYEMDLREKARLDQIEGTGQGYHDVHIRIPFEGCPLPCFTYQAQADYIDDTLQPYHWYKTLVLLGAEYLAFPPDYLDILRNWPSMEDANTGRDRMHQDLIERLRAANEGRRSQAGPIEAS
jgi:AIG2-like family